MYEQELSRVCVRYGGGCTSGVAGGEARGAEYSSAVKRSIGFTIGFHNQGEGPFLLSPG